jgi:hypothetical protein
MVGGHLGAIGVGDPLDPCRPPAEIGVGRADGTDMLLDLAL